MPQTIPGKLVIKFEAESASLANGFSTMETRLQVNGILNSHGLHSFERFVSDTAIQTIRTQLASQTSAATIDDLNRTYFVRVTETTDTKQLARRLMQLPGVAYAEPYYVYRTIEEPNDPDFGKSGQNFFNYHRITDAWEISKSSADVVIAIVDTGVQYNHEDLREKLWRNPEPGRASEIFTAVENDTIGWNFWQDGDIFAGEEPVQNNNPIGDYSHHGTMVAGLAAAHTNNGIGIAGTGYNAVYMPVKIGGTKDYPRFVPFGPQGILYAALNGADIINCSFGANSRSEFMKDIIDFAVGEGSFVVAAAGNSNNDSPLYPAAFPNVLSVGAESNTQSGAKAGFSSYGHTLDVVAVGAGVKSTSFNFDEDTGNYTDKYQSSSGTSYSAPIVSGIAALLRSEYPDWSPERVLRQIRGTARNVDENNPDLAYQLGKGSVDAYRALTDLQPGPQLINRIFLSDDGDLLQIGESGLLTATIVNYGESAELTFEAEVIEGDLQISNAHQQLYIAQGDSAALEIEINTEAMSGSLNAPLLRVTISSSGFDDFLFIDFDEFDYDVIQLDDFRISFSSASTIGYRETSFESKGGVGIVDNHQQNLLYEAGMMISVYDGNDRFVMDNTRSREIRNQDFIPVDWFRVDETGTYGMGSFVSDNPDKYPDLHVMQEVFRMNDPDFSNTLWVRYTLTNNGPLTLEEVYTGMYFNWDIFPFETNSAVFDPDLNMQIISSTHEDSPYISVVPVRDIASVMAIDNESEMSFARADSREDSLAFGIYYSDDSIHEDGFTSREKHFALTSGFDQTELADKDLSTLSSVGPFTIPPGQTAIAGFIISYSDTENQLRNQVSSALQFDIDLDFQDPSIEIPETTKLHPAYPNPFNPGTNISFSLPEAEHVYLAVYDVLGRRVRLITNESLRAGNYLKRFEANGLSSGTYFIVMRTQTYSHTQGITLIR